LFLLVGSGGNRHGIKRSKAEYGSNPETKHESFPVVLHRNFLSHFAPLVIDPDQLARKIAYETQGLVWRSASVPVWPRFPTRPDFAFTRPATPPVSHDQGQHRTGCDPTDGEHCKGFHIIVSQDHLTPSMAGSFSRNGLRAARVSEKTTKVSKT